MNSTAETDVNPLTIVLVEDDDGHAMLVEKNLKRAGLLNDVVRFNDGGGALQFVKDSLTSQPKRGLLVLADINMPGMDGVELLKVLKESDDTAQIPVIMLTTTDDPREVQNCYALGCSVYIVKPVSYDSFVEAMRRLGLFLQVVQVPRMLRS